MEQKKVDLAQIPDVQLKALIYDEQNKVLLSQNNIQALQQELVNRAKKAAETANMVEKKVDVAEAPAVDVTKTESVEAKEEAKTEG